MELNLTVSQYDRKMKRSLVKDWQALLPGMATLPKGYNLYFFKIIGPLVVMCGLGMSKDSLDYGPEFAIFNLCFEFPIIAPTNMHITLLANNVTREVGRSLYNIKPNEHKALYNLAFKALDSLSYGMLQDQDFSLQQIISNFKDYIIRSGQKFIGQELITLPLLAAWAGRVDQAQDLLSWSIEASKTANGNYAGFGEKSGWIKTVSKLILEPEKLREICRSSMAKHNLDGLPYKDFSDVVISKHSEA